MPATSSIFSAKRATSSKRCKCNLLLPLWLCDSMCEWIVRPLANFAVAWPILARSLPWAVKMWMMTRPSSLDYQNIIWTMKLFKMPSFLSILNEHDDDWVDMFKLWGLAQHEQVNVFLMHRGLKFSSMWRWQLVRCEWELSCPSNVKLMTNYIDLFKYNCKRSKLGACPYSRLYWVMLLLSKSGWLSASWSKSGLFPSTGLAKPWWRCVVLEWRHVRHGDNDLRMISEQNFKT